MGQFLHYTENLLNTFIDSCQIELVSYCLIWYSCKSVSCKRIVQCCKYVWLDFALLIKYNSITHKYYFVTTSTVKMSSHTFLCKCCVLHPTHGYRKCKCCKTKPILIICFENCIKTTNEKWPNYKIQGKKF